MNDFIGVLTGVRVLEICEGIAGPVCGQQLADLGADVIKVEPPEGDRARTWGVTLADGQSAIFAHLNRGKRSVTCDVADEAGRAALKVLVDGADVIVVHQDPAQARAPQHARPAIDFSDPPGPYARAASQVRDVRYGRRTLDRD